ncbi:MAG TPA: ABC transporter permease [Anaerolineales bacterium]|nr:ABC transporter permease [Anaerolineales bacterium]
MQLNFQRLTALMRKETIQILRDRRFIFLFLGLTFVQLFVYSYSASRTVYHLPMAVVDQSHDSTSRAFIQALINSQYFNATMYLDDQSQAKDAIDKGQVKAALIVPPHFASEVDQGSANFLMLLDGSDQFAVRSGYSAAGAVAQNFGLQMFAESHTSTGVMTSTDSALPVNVFSQILYNPDMNDKWFVIPGIIGMILQTLAVEQAAIFLVRDREWGTMEQILATPVRQLELILSKMIPLAALCLLAFGVSVGLGIFWFGVPFHGNLFLYFWLALLFLASCLGLGLVISTRANTQFEADASSLIFMLFGLLLSGLFYPRTGMPLIPQLIGDIAPLTYFLRISRGIYMKGVGLSFLWSDALILVIYTLVVVFVSSKRFKMRLD